MQFEPNLPLAPQLRSVSSGSLEQLAAACVASAGYFTMRNLRLEDNGETLAEADVLASLITPLRESRILIECKGGQPTPSEIRKFSALKQLLEPAPDQLLMIVRHGYRDSRKRFADRLGIRVTEKTNLAFYVLPLLGGAAVREARTRHLNRFLAWQAVHDYLVARAAQAHERVRQHHRFLVTNLWSIEDPEQQVKDSFDAYSNEFTETWKTVEQAKGLSHSQALYQADDDDFEAATYVVLLHRLINTYALVRRTLDIGHHDDAGELVDTMGTNLRAAASTLSSRPTYIAGFLSFLQIYFFLWGGFMMDHCRELEVRDMAEDAGVSPESIDHYLQVLNQIYSGPSASLFTNWNGHTYFRYIPGAFRALGMLNREARAPERYDSVTFFGARSNRPFRAALERALSADGGTASLRIGYGGA